GFSVAKPTTAHAAGPLTLLLALSGNAHGRLTADARGLTLTRAGAQLRYTGLRATDARGRTLRSWLELRSRQLLLRVDARGASYPLQIDPFVEQVEELP